MGKARGLLAVTVMILLMVACGDKERNITVEETRAVNFTTVQADTPISGGETVDLNNSSEFTSISTFLKCLQISLPQSHLKLVDIKYEGDAPELKVRGFVSPSKDGTRTLMFEWTFKEKGQLQSNRIIYLSRVDDPNADPAQRFKGSIITDAAGVALVNKQINSSSRQFYITLELTSNKAVTNVQIEARFFMTGSSIKDKCK